MNAKIGKKRAMLWGLGVVVILLLSTLILAPRVVRMQSLGEKLVQLLSEKNGLQIQLESIELSYLPLPHLEITGAKIAIPGTGEGHLGEVAIYPRLFELLKGKARFSRIELLSPRLRIALSEMDGGTSGVQSRLAPLLASLGVVDPDLELVLRDGTVDLVREERPLCSLKNLDVEVTFPPKGLLIQVSCTSDLFDRFSLEGNMDPETLRGKGSLRLDRFRLQPLVSLLLPQSSIAIGESFLSLGSNIDMQGKLLQADIHGSIPVMRLLRNGKETVIRSSGFKGSGSLSQDGLRLEVQEFRVEEPRMNVSGEYAAGGTGEGLRVRLRASNLDISSVGKAAVAISGDPDVAEVFSILQQGKATVVSFQSGGATWSELLELDHLIIHGKAEGAKVLVPGAGLELEDVSGEAVLAGGVLDGKNLQARCEGSFAREGTLRVGLIGEDLPLHLEIEVDADVAQVPPVLKRFLKDETFLRELEKIHDLEGRARGRLILGENTSNILARVDVRQLDLSAGHDGIPHPVILKGGRFLYEPASAQVKEVECRVGGSSIAGLSCDLQFSKEPQIALEIRDARIAAEEIFSWISSSGYLGSRLKRIRTLGGEMVLKEARVKGPLMEPETWHFETRGEVLGLTTEADFLPGPLHVSKGKWRADPKSLVLEDMLASIFDTTLNVSGVVEGTPEAFRRTDLQLGGLIGPRAIGEMARLSLGGKPLHVRSAFSLKGAHFTWDQEGAFSFKGDLAFPGGPDIAVDVHGDRDHWDFLRVLLKDGWSNADLSCSVQREETTFSFSGKLNEKTLGNVLEGYEFQDGWVEGDFRLHWMPHSPLQSWAKGKLEADDFTILHLLPSPVELDRISLTADGRRVNMKSVEFMWAETRFEAEGSLQMGEEGLIMDMDFYSSALNWEQVKSYMPAPKEGEAVPWRGEHPRFPLLGSVRVHFEEFAFKTYTWRPFKAEALFSPQKVEARITEANTCGISTLGSATVTPEGLTFILDAGAESLELQPCMQCFFEGRGKVTGDFHLKLEVRGNGNESELLPSLDGTLTFSATKGRVLEHMMFQEVLRFLSITEVLAGKAPDIGKEGIGFDSIVIHGEIRDGLCVFREAVFDGVDMEVGFEGQVNLVDQTIEGRLLVAPFRTVDRIVNFIPVVRTIMGGSLVSIPIKVEGSLAKPRLTPLAPSAVGQGLVNMMKRTFLLPVEIFDPAKHKRN